MIKGEWLKVIMLLNIYIMPRVLSKKQKKKVS